MSPEQWERCKGIFCDALALQPEDQILLLDRECGDDAELRDEVVKMLGAASDEASPLDVGAAERVLGGAQITEFFIAGDVVGRYRVIRRIGQGGTSLVYLAEHVGLHSPRRFAIKVIALAFVAGQRERFNRECAILAGLEHPNIARILDQGVAGTGWPYLVMDYIDGVPIHRYCIEHKLAPPEIVRLLLECCRAVEYFHRNQVVHCDLKPANILVDASGSPRILDFGIARLVEPDRITRSGVTTRGIRPLTPDYASPEQLAGATLTPASDIYSLGVVFYEALTGALPFDFPDEPWPVISRKLAELDPAPPSKVRARSGSREDLQFARQLRGDLDAIVLKTLAYDSQQRYESVAELMADLSRYLDGESVKARRSGWGEQAGKFAQRRRRLLVEVGALLLTAALFAGYSAWRENRLEHENERSYVDRWRGFVERSIPRQLPATAAKRAEASTQLATSIELVAPEVSKHPGLIPVLAEAMIKGAALLGDPYQVSLGRLDQARAGYRRALELAGHDPDPQGADIRARAALGIGDTFSHPGVYRDPAQAARWYEQALTEISPRQAEFRRTTALAHARIGMVYELLGDAEEAHVHYRNALGLMPAPAGEPRSLGRALDLMERARAEPSETRGMFYREALDALNVLLEIDPDNVQTRHSAVEAHLSVGLDHFLLGKASDAVAEFHDAADLAQSILSKDPDDAQARREWAMALRRDAMVEPDSGGLADPDTLRRQAVDTLSLAIRRPFADEAPPPPSCPDPAERLMENSPTTPLVPGHLLLGNRQGSETVGALLDFSPQSKEMNVLVPHGYLSDVTDIVAASREEVYIIDHGLTPNGGVVRLRYSPEGWYEKQLSCGGLLRNPVSLAYAGQSLVVASSTGQNVTLVRIDPETGRQEVMGQKATFADPGKLIHSGDNFYLSLFWPGEGGPAEIISFNGSTGQFATAARYGLLEDPVALGATPDGSLIAGDRAWTGNGGRGCIVRIEPGVSSRARVVRRSSELARVRALTAVSAREAWYSTDAVPYSSSLASHAKLYRLDLETGDAREELISDKILASAVALARVD